MRDNNLYIKALSRAFLLVVLTLTSNAYADECYIGKKITTSGNDVNVDYKYYVQRYKPTWRLGYTYDATFYNPAWPVKITPAECERLTKERAVVILRNGSRPLIGQSGKCVRSYLNGIPVDESYMCRR